MSITLENVLALEALEAKLRAILPEQYRDSYEDVVPVSMGSAGLKYDADGRVAWDQIWGSFCDLAMAGGPPHRGTLLQPATAEAISANSGSAHRIIEEIQRGISLVTRLPVQPNRASANTGAWVGVQCRSVGMAGWLVRAIVMENILATARRGNSVPACGSGFPSRQRNQERDHCHGKDVSLLDRVTCRRNSTNPSMRCVKGGSIGSELLEPASAGPDGNRSRRLPKSRR